MSSTTSLVVSFGDTDVSWANVHLSAEIDRRLKGLNQGKTSFSPGERAWFLIYMSDNVALDGDPSCSAGTISGGQLISGIEITEDVTFMNVNTSTTKVPATSIKSVKWIGRSLGNIVLTGNNTGLQADSAGVAVAKITYLADAVSYAITSPVSIDGETSFSIAVMVLGKVI